MSNFKNINAKEKVGKVVLQDDIIYGIVLLAVSELDDVEIYNPNVKDSMRNKSVKVKFNKDKIVIDVIVKVNFNKCISDMAFKIQEVIRHNVEAMTEYHIESVNVHVHGVSFEEMSLEPAEKITENTEG